MLSLFIGLPAGKLDFVERVRERLGEAVLGAFDRVEALADAPSMAAHGGTDDPTASDR